MVTAVGVRQGVDIQTDKPADCVLLGDRSSAPSPPSDKQLLLLRRATAT